MTVRRGCAILMVAVTALLTVPSIASAAPSSVDAWYMYGTTLATLRSNAQAHGCNFASNHTGTASRLMMLDFGAARQTGPTGYGASDFSSTTFPNGDILTALEDAADGVHNCYVNGVNVIAYGNSNYHMSNNGITGAEAHDVGYFQSQRAHDLAVYQSNHNYGSQAAAAGSDIELSWDGPGISRNLSEGATDYGYALYYDYGSADGCPTSGTSGSCNNGWAVGDVANASFAGSAVPLPEIYYSSNDNQWTVVRKNWDNAHSTNYLFWGTTGTTGTGFTPAGGWNALEALNSGKVLSELICFC